MESTQLPVQIEWLFTRRTAAGRWRCPTINPQHRGKEWVEPYLYSPTEPSWHVTGRPLALPTRNTACRLTLRLLMSYIYGAPSKARNANVVYRCPRRNVQYFGRVFLMLNYNDITQNTYIQSSTVTKIMAREKCDLLAGPRNVPVSWQSYTCPSLSVVSYYGNSAHARSKILMYFLHGDNVVHVSAWHSCHV